MPRSLWEKVLREVASWNRPVTLLTHGAGEPLLFPDLEALLVHGKEIPHVSIGFMTNGMLLNAEWSTRLVDLQVDFLALSIDGTEPASHDHFRVHASLEKIEANVRALIAEKKRRGSDKPALAFNMVGYPEILHQAEDYARRWLPHAHTVTVSRFRPVGSRRLWPQGGGPPFRPCPLLTQQLVIGCDGRVGLCCEDIHLEGNAGSLHTHSILQIYNESPVFSRYREAHAAGDLHVLPLCRDCDVWGGDVVLETSTLTLADLRVSVSRTPAFHVFTKDAAAHEA